MTNYISFVGHFDVLPNEARLKTIFQEQIRETEKGDIEPTGYINGVHYRHIGGQDSLSIYLVKISRSVGYLVADCQAGGWCNSAFVKIDSNGNPVKSADNFNPNPVEQVI